jgi:hypothetical protein
MGQIIASPKVKLITAVMITPSFPVDEIMDILNKEWGVVDLDMDWYAFDHSRYYDGEFGPSLQKTFLSFDALVDIESMPAVKIRTNQIEDRYESGGNRRVNIDPGYIADAKLIMPTTKNLSHRIYIGQGIYGDQQLMYRGKTFNTMPWTFADYKQPTVIDFFNRVRHRYFEQLKESGTLPVYG